MIKPPSLVREYTWIWSKDPALNTPPDDAPEEARKEWERRLEVARETGQWDALLKPGEKPTRFSMRLIPGDVWRKFIDAHANAGGAASLSGMAVRLALRGVSDLQGTDGKDIKVTFGPSEYGQIAKADVVDELDAIWLACSSVIPNLPNIVGEMAAAIYERQNAPSPK